ncbi:MAG: DUF4434 domain-containing protein [Ruminococcaceae bacterium]|nr:DUF4434 domain-containing protein [Oscillospiraceae bacterium]
MIKELMHDSIYTKPITGSWFEFRHHNTKEGKYWNDTLQNFTEDQWRVKVREMKEAGIDQLAMLATALKDKAYFKTDIFPERWLLAVDDPIEIVLDEADKIGMNVYMSSGFYGNWRSPENNITDPKVLSRMLRAMNELAELYGHHKSFYGWYYPDETWIGGYMDKAFIDFVNLSSAEVHKLDKRFKTLIGPYGTKDLHADDRYIQDLERLDIDFIAYQDEVGVEKSTPDQTAKYFEALKRAHDKAGRAKLWADIELFCFEGEVYHSALLPAPFERVREQLEAVSPYVEKVFCYEYPGLMSKPGSIARLGHPNAEMLYADYMNYRKSFEE